jgi:hypothetical protein
MQKVTVAAKIQFRTYHFFSKEDFCTLRRMGAHAVVTPAPYNFNISI